MVGDQDGNLYGTTVYGGSDVSCMPDRLPVGCGTVFKLAPNRTLTTLYAFKNLEDGFEAEAPLYRSPRTGALFGTTSGGGPVDCSQISSDGCGTVFMVTPDGNKQTLHAFSGPDGYGPDAPLIRGSGAQLLGTAFGGGANQYGGVIYSLQLTE